MIIQRTFSIQSGGPNGGAGSLKKELLNKIKGGAIAGGVIGTLGGIVVGAASRSAEAGAVVAGGSVIVGAIASALTALGANWRRAEAENATMNSLLDYLYGQVKEWDREGYRGKDDIQIERYIIEDGDPDKFMVNFSYEDGKLIIYLNKPSNAVIESINDDLETLVKFNRKADYASSQINNGFMVYVICPSLDSAAEIIYNVIAEHHIKVNAITEKSLKKFDKTQKTFASIKEAKKATTNAIRILSGLEKGTITQEGARKAAGQLNARAVNAGLGRPSLLTNKKAVTKIAKSGVNQSAKELGVALSPQEKREAVDASISAARQNARRLL